MTLSRSVMAVPISEQSFGPVKPQAGDNYGTGSGRQFPIPWSEPGPN